MTKAEAVKWMTVVTEAFYLAAAHIMEVYSRDFTVKYKEDASPVTEADQGANQIITQVLAKAYPSYAILAEETAENELARQARLANPYCFIVDPLDGTKEFVAHVDQFSINIALAHRHEILAGAVYSPTEALLYYAVRGLGAYRTATDGKMPENFFDEKDRIHVSSRTEQLVAMVSRSHIDEKTRLLLDSAEGKISHIISAGSALKGCRIAAGEADVYYRMGHTMEWDTAANQVIVEEAGGEMRQLDAARSPFTYNRENSLNANGFYILNRPENKLVPDDFILE